LSSRSLATLLEGIQVFFAPLAQFWAIFLLGNGWQSLEENAILPSFMKPANHLNIFQSLSQ
jgi:hypothetical protein